MKWVRQKQPRLRLDPQDYDHLRWQVLRRDGWRCQWCGAISNLEVHHREFRSHSGGDSEETCIVRSTKDHGLHRGGGLLYSGKVGNGRCSHGSTSFPDSYLGLCDVDFRREPLLRHGLKNQFTLGDRKLHSTTRAHELPIFGVAGPNANCCPVLND